MADKPVISITNMKELPSREIDVFVEVGDQVWQFPCKELTYKRYKELGRLCPDPAVPFVAGPKGKIYDYADPAYQQARSEAEDRRMYLRLTEFLQIDIPGKDIEAQADYLADNLPLAVVTGLARVVNASHERGETRVEARSESFRK